MALFQENSTTVAVEERQQPQKSTNVVTRGADKTIIETGQAVTTPKPISEDIEQLVFERASGKNALEVLGTACNVYAIGHESLIPAYVNPEITDTNFRVHIGSSRCSQPYSASVFNGSALSYGPLSKNFIMGLNRAAKTGKFYQNTGEAGISPYHFGVDIDIEDPNFDMMDFVDTLHQKSTEDTLDSGDLVWEIGNGYFGCRTEAGGFDNYRFEKISKLPCIKMIELKLSQGMPPGKNLPMPYFTSGFSKILNVPQDASVKLASHHSEFSTPRELVEFVEQLRVLSGGKPVGIKTSLGHKHQFLAICKAMVETGLYIDFITIDGMEAATSGSVKSAAGFCGVTLNEAIVYAHNVLTGLNLREQVKIIASGKIFTEKDIVLKLARGADLCASARGILLSAGCDQQRECYKGTCLKGIATQDRLLQSRLDPGLVQQQIYNYHSITINELAELLSIMGITHPNQISPSNVHMRVNLTETLPLDQIYQYLKPGHLLPGFLRRVPKNYEQDWKKANIDINF